MLLSRELKSTPGIYLFRHQLAAQAYKLLKATQEVLKKLDPDVSL